MGVTEADVGPGSQIAIGYDGLPDGTTIKIYVKSIGTTTFSVYPNSPFAFGGGDVGLAWTRWINDPTPGVAEDWGTGTSDVYANSATGPFSGGTDIGGPLYITWHPAPTVGIASYPAYPGPTVTLADWSVAHPHPTLAWLPLTPNDSRFGVAYTVSRAFDPAGPWTDALGIVGIGGYRATSFTDDGISGSSGTVYYRIAGGDGFVGPTTYTQVSVTLVPRAFMSPTAGALTAAQADVTAPSLDAPPTVVAFGPANSGVVRKGR